MSKSTLEQVDTQDPAEEASSIERPVKERVPPTYRIIEASTPDDRVTELLCEVAPDGRLLINEQDLMVFMRSGGNFEIRDPETGEE